MKKIINCKVCGAEIASSAKICPACGAKNKPPIHKRWWFWVLVIFVALSILGSFMGGKENTNNSNNIDDTDTSDDYAANSETSVFEGDCGVAASAEMGSSIIEYPELTISITNTTEKEISAIQFYAVPYDVYGDEITGWTSQNRLYTDTAIGAGQSDTLTYQFIEDRVKTLDLYVYSVYFSDGTEWGDKNASESTILNSGKLIEVSGES